jgi:cob(I)alamin adenosyltransferase
MTSLYGGQRIPKFHARMDVVGSLDELNAMLGLVLAEVSGDDIREPLLKVQNTLFNIGAEVAEGGTKVGRMIEDSVRVTEGKDKELEEWIDQFDEELPPLSGFILPGGSPAGARLHHARTVCRRAERMLARLADGEVINPHSLKYMNRLSDFLFVLARVVNARSGAEETYWQKEIEKQ